MVPRILIIAGSDSGGAAGIQADIKTVTMLGGHAMTAITAITAQNTVEVREVFALPDAIVRSQIQAVLDDLGVDAVKIGMLGTPELVWTVYDQLHMLPPGTPVVLDPVMVATSGAALNEQGTANALFELAGLVNLVTPNIPELAALSGGVVDSEAAMREAAAIVAERFRCPVLAKGGHLDGDELVDLLVDANGQIERWSGSRIDTLHTHGTGCTLSSAIAAGLGSGLDLPQAIGRARAFVRGAMLAAPGLGAGHGPMGHHASVSGAVNLNHVTLPAADYDASVIFYRTLGLKQIVDAPPRYARFECPGGATLSIHAGEPPQASDAAVYFEAYNLDEWVERLQGHGVSFESLPRNESWGWREARLRDPAGNRLCLYWAGENRRFPPWRIGQ